MNKKILLFIILNCAAVPAAFAADMDKVAQGLDEYARANDLPAENIKAPAPQAARHKYEVAVERYGYTYRETVDGAQFMRINGYYNGLLLAYTFRPLDVDALSQAMINVLRAEFRFAAGSVDYTGSGSWSGLKDSTYELRAIVGHDFSVDPTVKITPYAGLGYRYLNNGGEAMPSRVIDGQPYYSGYNRESTYYYVPVGVNAQKDFAGGYGLGLNLEYDYWYAGRQVSHLEDMQDMGGVNAGYDPLINRQRDGFGWRGSVKFSKDFPRMRLSVEPYYRYWKVQQSDIQFLTKGGQLVPVPGFPGYYEAGQEPDNITREIGVRMGVQF